MSAPVRLVLAFLRRTPGLIVLVPVAFFLWMPSFGRGEFTGGAVVSQVIVGLVAVIGSLTFLPRPVYYLPVSRQEFWRAQWLLCVIVAPLVVLIGKVLALMLISAGTIPVDRPAYWSRSGQIVLLTTLADIAYGGSFPAMVWLMRLASRRLGRHGSRVVFGLTAIWFAGCVGWPFLWRDSVLLRVADLASPAGVVLAVALVLVTASRWHVPRPTPRAGQFKLVAPPGYRDRPARQPLVTGLPGLLLHEALVSTAMVLVVFIAMVLGRSVAAGTLDVAADARSLLVVNGAHFFGGVVPTPAVFWVIVASARNGLQPIVRQLRALPLATWHLELQFLLTPTLPMAILAGLVGVLRFTLTGVLFTAGDLAALIASIGLATLAQSVQLRRRERWSVAAFGVAIAAGVIGGALQIPAATQGIVSPVTGGLTMLLLAAALNHYWITRSTLTYRGSLEAAHAAR